MTDEEIIGSLSGSILNAKRIKSKCWSIEIYKLENALDLINRQKAEIENLKLELKAMRGAANSYKMALEKDQKVIERQEAKIKDKQSEIDCMKYKFAVLKEKIKNQKSEAIKEFAERLKSKLDDLEFRTKTHRKTVPTKFCDDNANWVLHECVPEEIDKLIKEMTEEEK